MDDWTAEAKHFTKLNEVDRAAELREHFANRSGEGIALVGLTAVGATVYCLVQEPGADHPSLLIARTRVFAHNHVRYISCSFYREGEPCGDGWRCPQWVLDSLTPTADPAAAAYRKECRARHRLAAERKRRERHAMKGRLRAWWPPTAR